MAMNASRGILSHYLDAAMARARLRHLDDGTYVGRIPACPGLLGFGPTENETREDLRVNLEDWVLVGLRVGDELPVFAGIDLNVERALEPVEAI